MNRNSYRKLGTSQWMSKLQKILQNKGINGLSVPCNAYFRKHRRHFIGGILVLCFFAIIAPFTIITTSKRIQRTLPRGDLPEYKQWQQSLSTINEVTRTNEHIGPYGQCIISEPKNTMQPIKPVLVPFFPGGSSDFVNSLIEASTGIWTGNRADKRDIIAIKTHFPYYDKHVSVKSLNVEDPSAVVVMRDPLDTIEMWHTFIENSLNDVDDKTTPTTVNRWIEWRDRHFEEEIAKWDGFVRYWLHKKNFTHERRHIAIYEELIDPSKGAQATVDMIQFIFKMTNAQKSVATSKIPCIWHKLLQLKGERRSTSQQQPAMKQQKHRRLNSNNKKHESVVQSMPTNKPYTYIQLDRVVSTLTQMIDDFAYDERILTAFLRYRESILERMSLLKGNDPILVNNSHGVSLYFFLLIFLNQQLTMIHLKTCIVTNPKYEQGFIPIFQASYPGSGSQMMRDLVEAITGYKTNESHRRNDVVAIKTLYPYRTLDISPGFFNRDMKRLILLVRYPLNAISSNFAHVYWTENGIAPHSTQPPKEEWEKWRDNNFLAEIDSWIDFFMFWINSFKQANRMIVSYESMYHAEKGPKQAMRLAFFIKGSSGGGTEIDPAPEFTVPCLWFRAVRINDQANTDMYQANRFHHSNSNYVAMYTKEQLEMAATKIHVLYRKFNYDLQLGPLLQSYWEHTIALIKAESSTPSTP